MRNVPQAAARLNPEPQCRAIEDPLTAGYVSLLAHLSPGQRDALRRRPRLRSQLAEWFRRGDDPIIRAELLRLLAPRAGRR